MMAQRTSRSTESGVFGVDERELDRLSELANIGAGHAATAFSTLTGRPIWMDVPRVCDQWDEDMRRVQGGEPSAHGNGPHDEWSTGVFFEFEGYLNAVVGILFHAAASEAVVRRVVGIEEGELSAHCIESALMEVGNILASHVASAIADTVGQRLLPSIPTLAMNHAERELDALVRLREGEHRVRIECVLKDEAGELGGMLVLIPEAESA
jgi:chemotaxis protein CheC